MIYRNIKPDKRLTAVIFLIAAAMLLLTACRNESHFSAGGDTDGNLEYTVDSSNHIITVNGERYRYELSKSGDTIDFNVTYPDGSVYYLTSQQGAVIHESSSIDYDPEKYVPGNVLYNLVPPDSQRDFGKYILPGFLLLLVGVVSLTVPRAIWALRYGWRYKDAEPSDMALFIVRAVGVIAAAAGVICFFL